MTRELEPRESQFVTRVLAVRRRPAFALWAARALLLLVLVLPSAGSASAVNVPINLQVKLLAKVAAYDRNMEDRAAGKVRILIVERASHLESDRSASRIVAALDQEDAVAGLPHEARRLTFDSAGKLADAVRAGSIDIVYLTPGLDDEVPNIRKALSGEDVLSVSAVTTHVQDGVVLGFDLAGGKPKLLVHLPTAKAQNVAFKPSLLKLAKVYR